MSQIFSLSVYKPLPLRRRIRMRTVEDNTQVMRLRSGRDRLPGGYLASFAPVLVDWRASDWSGDSPYLIVRNVNYGGNPLERSVILHSARVPLDGIAFAEFTLVPFGITGSHSLLQHAELRFVFDPAKPPQYKRFCVISCRASMDGALASRWVSRNGRHIHTRDIPQQDRRAVKSL